MCRKLKGFGIDRKYRTKKPISKEVLSGVQGVQTEKGSGDGVLPCSLVQTIFVSAIFARTASVYSNGTTDDEAMDVLLVVPPSERTSAF